MGGTPRALCQCQGGHSLARPSPIPLQPPRAGLLLVPQELRGWGMPHSPGTHLAQPGQETG